MITAIGDLRSRNLYKPSLNSGYYEEYRRFYTCS